MGLELFQYKLHCGLIQDCCIRMHLFSLVYLMFWTSECICPFDLIVTCCSTTYHLRGNSWRCLENCRLGAPPFSSSSALPPQFPSQQTQRLLD